MCIKILAVGELDVSSAPDDEIKTYALGSCAALIVFDPETRSVGMVHLALPDSRVNPDRSKNLPGYFVDTGIPALLDAMDACGGNAGGAQRAAKVCGGANVMDPNNVFRIGQRNVEAIRSCLAKRGLRIAAEDVGGSLSRTVTVCVRTAKVTLSSPGRPDWKL